MTDTNPSQTLESEGVTPTCLLPQQPFAQVADQVLKQHKAGVRQTDLKPDNIMVNDNNEVMIVDADSFEFEEGEVGTPARKVWSSVRLPA